MEWVCHHVLITWKYIVLERAHVGGHKEFLYDAVFLVVGVLVDMLSHVSGGGCISGCDE